MYKKSVSYVFASVVYSRFFQSNFAKYVLESKILTYFVAWKILSATPFLRSYLRKFAGAGSLASMTNNPLNELIAIAFFQLKNNIK